MTPKTRHDTKQFVMTSKTRHHVKKCFMTSNISPLRQQYVMTSKGSSSRQRHVMTPEKNRHHFKEYHIPYNHQLKHSFMVLKMKAPNLILIFLACIQKYISNTKIFKCNKWTHNRGIWLSSSSSPIYFLLLKYWIVFYCYLSIACGHDCGYFLLLY